MKPVGNIDRNYARYSVEAANDLTELTEDEYLARVAAEPNDPEILASYAEFLLGDPDRLKESERYFKRVLELRPKDANALGSYARCLKYQRRFDEAEEYHLKALELTPNDPYLLEDYASVVATQGRNEEAEELYKRALALAPNDAMLNECLAVFLACIERPADAEVYFKRALELGNGEGRINTVANYASFLKEQGRDREAEDKYYEALSAVTADTTLPAQVLAMYLRNLSDLCFKRGDFIPAADALKASLELEETADGHFMYAAVLEGLGRAEEADDHYKIAAALQNNAG